MPEILVIKDAVRDAPFALVVKNDDSFSFYGFHEMGSDWAEHAQKTVFSATDIKATFKSVSENTAKSIIDKTLSKKIELNEFAEKVIKKTFASKTVFVGRTIIDKTSEIETKSEKLDKTSSSFSKFDYRAKSFKNKIKKISFIKEAKSKKVSIDTKSGKFIDQRSEYKQSFESMKIQESAGFGMSRKISRFMDEKAEIGCTSNRSLRRVKSISENPESNHGSRIDKAIEESIKRF
jgi:hypothetical protein